MNRAAKRALKKQGKTGKRALLDAAQALSREELDNALRNWGGLAGNDNFETVRSVTLTNRLGKRVVVTATLTVTPAPEAGLPYLLLLHPSTVHPSAETMRVLEADQVPPALVEVVRDPNADPGLAVVLTRAELTNEQLAALYARAEEGEADAPG